MDLETRDTVVPQIIPKIIKVLTGARMTLAVATDGKTVQEITITQKKILRKMSIPLKLKTPLSFEFRMILSIVFLQEGMPKLVNFKINLGPKLRLNHMKILISLQVFYILK